MTDDHTDEPGKGPFHSERLAAAFSAVFSRHGMAALTATAAVPTAGVGAYMQWGQGVALLTVAVLCIGLALLLGWE